MSHPTVTSIDQPGRGRRLARASGVAFAAALALAGCSAEADPGAADSARSTASQPDGGAPSAAPRPTLPDGSPDRAGEAEATAVYNQRLFACFEDLGIEVGAPDAGSPGAEASINATGEEIEAAIAECETRIGPQPMPAPLTDDEIVRMYDWAVETGACIRENGGQTTDPPSLEVYIETYRASLTGGASPWSPYDLVRGTTLFTLCPDFSLVP